MGCLQLSFLFFFPSSLFKFLFGTFFFFLADGITGKETHIHLTIFSSIDWPEDLLAFQVFWTHGVFAETLSWFLISHWDFIIFFGIHRLDTPFHITCFFNSNP